MESKIIEILGFIFLMFFVIGIHELGHLVAGLIQGFRFELFVIGPLGIKRENDKIKVYLNKNLAYYGGVAATLPVDDNPKNRKKFARLILAGPITSLVLSIVLFVCGYFFELPAEKWLLKASVGSMAIFLATTLPSKTGTFFTDRKRYQRVLSKGKVGEVEMAMLRVLGIYNRDQSYKNISKKDIELMIQDKDYNYFGLFSKLNYEYEINGVFDLKTKLAYDEVMRKMPKSVVKMMNSQLKILE